MVSPPNPTLSIVIVTHNSGDAVRTSLAAIASQLGPQDQLIVVDNASTDGTVEVIAELAPDAITIRNPTNEGFAAACNTAADRAAGELLVLLNPDVEPADDFCEAIRKPATDGRGWAAWMGLVTADRGETINTSGGVVHFSGIAWAGDAGSPASNAPTSPREVAFLSGACLAVPRKAWLDTGGFPPNFFMYCEDVDLSLRLRLAGGRLGIEPAARVDHDYEFAKGGAKWRLLERNRWATIIRTYPGSLLALVFPALVMTEPVILLAAIGGGWGRQKLLATLDTLRSLPRLMRERRTIQASRRIDAREFARWLTPDLDSRYIGRAGEMRLLRFLLRSYWRFVLLALRASRTRR